MNDPHEMDGWHPVGTRDFDWETREKIKGFLQDYAALKARVAELEKKISDIPHKNWTDLGPMG